MSGGLRGLARSALTALGDALRAGRVAPPYTRQDLAGFAPPGLIGEIVAAFEEMRLDGMAPRHIARVLALLAVERAASQQLSDRLELVWSPAELDQVDCRDTAVVVQDLFRVATRSVLIVTFALDQGAKAEALFGELAARMDAEPDLTVRVIANIHREHGDDTPPPALRRAFATRLRDKVWPGSRLPEVYYDQRSLSPDQHAVLHAKCVVVDRRLTLLTSANFTEAAQQRNIEVGVVVDDPQVADRLTQQFERLMERGTLERLL